MDEVRENLVKMRRINKTCMGKTIVHGRIEKMSMKMGKIKRKKATMHCKMNEVFEVQHFNMDEMLEKWEENPLI